MAVDGTTLARITAELAATSYHRLLAELVQLRIATLLADDVTDPYVAMKRRGQVEELQRLLSPMMLQAIALRGLEQQERAVPAMAPPEPLRPPRDWWADPEDAHA